jgi:hypothetical protein
MLASHDTHIDHTGGSTFFFRLLEEDEEEDEQEKKEVELSATASTPNKFGSRDNGQRLYIDPSCKFHTNILPSKSPEKRYTPSGEKQREVMGDW